MSKKSKSTDNVTRLERRLAKIKALERRKFLNEDIVRLEKNGDLSYQRVRTFRSPTSAPSANSYTETPVSPENGQQFDALGSGSPPPATPAAPPEVVAASSVSTQEPHADGDNRPAASDGISIHDDQTSGQKIPSDTADPLEDLLARALSRPRRGRPASFDDHNKGKLVALLSLGMSLRQAAAVLGVSHGTIRNTLQADPALAEEITAARFQAQLQPLACVIREARRSWKAATWLLKYLDGKIASHEETPDERRERQQRESDEFFARAAAPGVKTRRVLG